MMPKFISNETVDEVAIDCSNIIGTKVAPESILKGQVFTYCLSFENTSSEIAMVTAVTDYLPSEFKLKVSEEADGIQGNSNVIVSIKNGDRITTLLEDEYMIEVVGNKIIITNIYNAMDIPPMGKLQITISGRT